MLLPILGRVFHIPCKPRAMPWAKCFWAFSPRQLMRTTYGFGFLFGCRFSIQPARRHVWLLKV